MHSKMKRLAKRKRSGTVFEFIKENMIYSITPEGQKKKKNGDDGTSKS